MIVENTVAMCPADSEPAQIVQFLNQMGKDGWEAWGMAVASDPQAQEGMPQEAMFIFLKRTIVGAGIVAPDGSKITSIVRPGK